MLEGLEKDTQYILPVSWCSQCSHFFCDNHYSLFYSETNAADSSVSGGTKHYGLRICTRKTHLIENYWDILLLQVVQLCVGKVANAKRKRNTCYETQVPKNERTFFRDITACKRSSETGCLCQLYFKLIILFLIDSLYCT